MRLGALLGLLLLGAVPAVHAQGLEDVLSGGEEAQVEEPSAEDRLGEVVEELASTQELLALATESGKPTEHLTRQIELLGQIESLLAQRIAAVESLGNAEDERVEARRQLEEQRASGIPVPPPYSYLVLESVRDQVRDERVRYDRAVSAASVVRDSLSKEEEDFEAKERERRVLKEAYERGADGDDAAQLAIDLHLAELESEHAAEIVRVHEADIRLREVVENLSALRLEALEEALAYVSARATLTEEDRTSVALDLARREERLEATSDSAQRALQYLNAQWLDAKRRLDQGPRDDVSVAEEVETLKQGQVFRRAQLAGAAASIQRVKSLRTLWGRRFAVFTGRETEETYETWRAESEEALRDLEIERSLVSGHLADARTDLVTLQGRTATDLGPAVARWLSQRESYLDQLTDVYEENLANLELLRRLHRRLVEEIGTEESTFDLRSAGSDAWSIVLGVWGHELLVVEDRPITVGKIVTGLLLLFFGIFLSRGLSRFVGRRLLPRFRLAEGALHALQSLVFYVLVVAFTLVALQIVNVPLTAFTILGGALAIGFGFGSQNLVNNFISGLILLVEQPIRAKDLIQIGSLYGTVEYIGLRSTRVRTGENVEIIVPNSTFLQENVVNWTLSGTQVRVKVTIGVAYGSPTRDVKELLKKAAQNHGRVLPNPEPVVLFANFGDNALEFELHIWTHMRTLMEQRLVESDLRFMIDSLCREAGITIAFPQRDLHVDTLRPLEVRVAPSEDAGPDRDGGGLGTL